MPIIFIEKKIKKSEILEIAKKQFGDLVKAVVDIKRKVMVIGAELHADEETLLLEKGSSQGDLWGINLYPEKLGEGFIEYDSLINIRPSQDNRSLSVNDPAIRQEIVKIVNQLVQE